MGHRCTIRKQGWLPAWPLLLLASSSHIPEAVSCSEDPVGVQDAPTTDVLLVVLDADLPWPRIHRGLHPTHHTRSLQALSTVWTQWGGGRKEGESGFWRGVASPETRGARPSGVVQEGWENPPTPANSWEEWFPQAPLGLPFSLCLGIWIFEHGCDHWAGNVSSPNQTKVWNHKFCKPCPNGQPAPSSSPLSKQILTRYFGIRISTF